MAVDRSDTGSSPFDVPPGSPDGIRAAAAALTRAATDIGTVGADVSRHGARSVAVAQWSGDAHAAYGQTYTAVTQLATGLESPLTRLASVASTYADALETAQKRIARALDAFSDAMTKSNAVAAKVNAEQAPKQAEVDAAKNTIAAYEHHMETATDDAIRAWAVFRHACDQAVRDAEDCRTGFDRGEEGSGFAEFRERLKQAVEGFHGVWDTLALDVPLSARAETAKEALAKAREAFGKARSGFTDRAGRIKTLEDLQRAGGATEAQLQELDRLRGAQAAQEERYLQTGISLRKVEGAAFGFGILKLATGTTGIGVDVLTIISPEDHGVMGQVDRDVAGTNAALVGTDLIGGEGALGEIFAVPGVGEVAMVGTGVYLGGNYLYHHWKPFRQTMDTAGSTIVKNVENPLNIFRPHLPGEG